jgi:hypothetical protein
VARELETRLRADLRKTGDFQRVHPLPHSGLDVPDEMDARLVVLGIDHPYTKEAGNRAQAAAKAIFESRGNTPRLFRNTLVFLAVDQARLQDLDESARRYLAWDSILDEKETLDLSPHQVKQAEAQKTSADGAVTARMPEAYQWLLVPTQRTPKSPIEWQATRLSGQEALAARASKKLKNDELLVTSFAPSRLRMELDRVLWRGDHIPIKLLVEDFARYLYLPRMKDPSVLLNAIRDGLGLLTWEKDSFGYADSYDEATGRYRGLKVGQHVSISDEDSPALLVKPEVAARQQAQETPASSYPAGAAAAAQANGAGASVTPATPPAPRLLTRFHGSVHLDASRLGRDAGRIAEEIVQHLATLVGSDVEVTLEIHAAVPNGTPDQVVRTVTENCRTLKFKDFGFEEE